MPDPVSGIDYLAVRSVEFASGHVMDIDAGVTDVIVMAVEFDNPVTETLATVQFVFAAEDAPAVHTALGRLIDR